MPRVTTIRGLGQDSTDTSFITDFSVPGSITEPVPTYEYSVPDVGGPGVINASGGYDVADVSNPQSVTTPTSAAAVPSSGVISLAQTAGNVIAAATTGTTGRGPSPTVQVPLSSSSIGLFLESATLIPGVPNWQVMFGGVALLAVVGSLAGGRRRRR